MDIGLSARGDEAEKLLLIEDLSHMEQHLAENMEAHPEMAQELGPELDRIRATRQEATRLFARGRENADFSCLFKHSGMGHLRSQEILNNTVRIHPEQSVDVAMLNARIASHRDFAVKKFLSGKGAGGGCVRCHAELSVVDEPILAQSLKMPKANKSHIKIKGDRMAKVDLKGLGMMEAGQLIGQGGIWLADKSEEWTPTNTTGYFRTRNLVNVLGGLVLAVGPQLLMKKNNTIKDVLQVTGTAMIAKGVVDVVKDASAGTAGRSRVSSRGRVVARQYPVPRENYDQTYGPNSPAVSIF